MVKIVSFFSFETDVLSQFDDERYVKLYCGNQPSSKEFLGKMDYIETDHPNIASMNEYYNEMTGIMWTHMNYDLIGNPDYIGFAHYRRILQFDESQLTPNTILCHFEQQPFSIYIAYQLYHVISDLKLFITEFVSKHSEYQQYLIAYMQSNAYPSRNIFITSRQLFNDEYIPFMKKCIDICNELKTKINIDFRDKYQKRVFGFILERMTGFWIYVIMHTRHDVNVIHNNLTTFDIQSPYQR